MIARRHCLTALAAGGIANVLSAMPMSRADAARADRCLHEGVGTENGK